MNVVFQMRRQQLAASNMRGSFLRAIRQSSAVCPGSAQVAARSTAEVKEFHTPTLTLLFFKWQRWNFDNLL